MQNAWKFVSEPELRDRLKEAKGIGTPATRAEIIKGLKAQSLLAAAGKHVVPTPAGLQLYEVLRAASPTLVDPGMTAKWEMQLDDVVLGRIAFMAVIDGIAASAAELIETLQHHSGQKVHLSTTPKRAGGSDSLRLNARKGSRSARATTRRKPRSAGPSHHGPKQAATEAEAQAPSLSSSGGRAPTPKMLAFARSLAKQKSMKLPPGCAHDFGVCRQFLDQNAQDSGRA